MRFARSGFFTVLLGIAVLAASEPLLAQQLSQLHPGQRVRVTIPSAGLTAREATLQSFEAGTITLRTERYTYVGAGWRSLASDTVELAVPIDSVRNLDVSLGRRNLAPEGAVIGGLIGAVVGGVLAKRDYDRCIARGGWICGSPGFAFIVGGGLGGLAGGGLGALFGLAIDRERWEPVPLSRVQVGIAPLPNRRVGLGASLAF